MSIDFTPKVGSANKLSMIATHSKMEFRLLSRQGEQLIVTMVIPLIALFIGTNLASGANPIDTAAPGALALAIMSSSFTSLAVSTGFERRYGLLRRLATTPLSRMALLVGKAGAVAITQVGQLTILAAVAFFMGWQPQGGLVAALWLVVLALLGTAAFGSLALLLAGTLRAEATLGIANLVYIILLVGGAIVLPLDSYPPIAVSILQFLPSSALGEGLRTIFTGNNPDLFSILVLASWALVAGIWASRSFKWE